MYISDNIIDLRPIIENDIDDKFIGWLNDPDVVKYSRQRYKRHSLQTSKAYLASFTNSSNLYLKLIENKTQNTIGSMTVYFDSSTMSADIGILIGDKSVWGKGYGIRAWVVLMDYLFDNTDIQKITGGCDVRNAKMISIFQKADMLEFCRENLNDKFSHYTVVRFVKEREIK